ncbi:MAG: UDP-N-acetylglucosamine 2-epimerase (non-hydrolyzing) [Pseudomonadota bacterium]|nr:UDP-N-acetylglucosamine 2-epimerase (non-hydrolyzing) [Pseudomonadota bacterium]
MASIIGTRPEAIKMAPVVRALQATGTIEQTIYLTGQHRRLEDHFSFLTDALTTLEVNCRGLSVATLRERLKRSIAQKLEVDRPDLIVVQGDTTSALAGALAGEAFDIPIAHVEAGLRSFAAEPWPEEENRVRIDGLSALLFAPTAVAAANLAADPSIAGAVHVTGNSGIDALFAARRPPPEDISSDARKTIVATCHRRENQDGALDEICAGLKRLVAKFPVCVVFPLHPNRHLRERVERLLADTDGISLVEPLGYTDMVALMSRAWLILTDSGGMQEEGPALGVPVVVLRDVTERVEAAGATALVGSDPDAIVTIVNRLLMDEVLYARLSKPSLPFGDGQAAPRIARLIEDWLVHGAALRA